MNSINDHPLSVERYYMNQAGGNVPIFVGSPNQRGHGIGSTFTGLMKASTPLITKGLMSVGKSVRSMAVPMLKNAGRQLLKSGKRGAKRAATNMIRDAVRGRNIKQSIKKRSLGVISDIFGRVNKRHGKKSNRVIRHRPVRRGRRTKRRKVSSKTIFG
jgi:hypothetical protein